jgi:hypothetical protein
LFILVLAVVVARLLFVIATIPARLVTAAKAVFIAVVAKVFVIFFVTGFVIVG